MNILVTGGAGYIGSGLLIKLGEEFSEATVTSLDNLERGDYRHVDYLVKLKRRNSTVVSKRAFQKIGHEWKYEVSQGISELFDFALKLNATERALRHV